MSANMYDAWDCGDRPAIREQLKQREDIIRMAREAGLPYEYDTGRILDLKQLERFAALVAEEVRGQTIESEKRGWLHAIDKMVAVEREACAVIAETPVSGEQDDITMQAKDRAAAAIRARGQA